MAAGMNMMVSAVQEAVGFERARMQNLFFLRGFQGKSRIVGPSAEALSNVAGAKERLDAARAGEAMVRQGTAREASAKAGRPVTAESLEVQERALMGMGVRNVPGIAFGTAGMGRRPRAVTREGQKLEKAADATIKAQQALEDAQKGAQSRTVTSTLEGMGVRMGLGPMQMQELLGQFMGARGGMAGGAQDQIQEAMAAQLRFGVGPQQAGQFARMQMAGGGGTQGASLATTLQGAFVTGLEGSQIPEFLETLVELGQSAEQRGLKLDPQEFVKMSMTLGRAGFEGLQAKRVAGGFVEATRGLAERGVQTPMDVMMLRAAGFRPEQGPGSYAKAVAALEDPQQQQSIMNNALRAISEGAGGPPEMQALLTKRALGKMGIRVGMAQASDVLASYQQGSPPAINDLLAEQAARGGRGGMIAEAGAMVPAAAQRAAQTELERIQLGLRDEVGVAVRGFEQNAIKLGQGIGTLGGQFTKVNEAVNGMLTSFNNFTARLDAWLGGDAKVPAGG
jgi:hypothetical protein